MADPLSEADLARLAAAARELRKEVVRMAAHDGADAPGASLAVADLFAALYLRELRVDPTRPDWAERDRFLLGAPLVAPAWYAALAHRGFFPTSELERFGVAGGRLPVLPERALLPGIDANVAVDGEGLALAAGIALDEERRGKGTRVFLMASTDEVRSGAFLEAVRAALQLRLAHLVLLLFAPRRSSTEGPGAGPPEDRVVEPLRALELPVVVIDGHDLAAVDAALREAGAHAGSPYVLLAQVRWGRGVPSLESADPGTSPSWNPAAAEAAGRALGGTSSP